MKSVALAGALAGGICFTASATTIINFDSLVGSASPSSGDAEIVDDQYRDIVAAGLGVDFNGTALAWLTNLGTSGSNEILNYSGLGYGGTIRIDSVGSEFTSLGGWFRSAAVNMTMEAFDASGFSLGAVNFQPPTGPSEFFGITLADLAPGALSFAYVEIRDSGNDFAIDDFQFDLLGVGAPAVPLPTGGAMALAGLCVLGARRRRI